MMIARWTCEAKFGMKSEAIDLLKEWQAQIGDKIGLESLRIRTVTGSVGAKESVIQDEFEIGSLSELDEFFTKLAGIEMHADWGKKMSDVLISGSTHWEVFRVVE